MAGETTRQPYTVDLEVPDVQLVGVPSGPQVTPSQRIYFYAPDEWERFILEWATGLEGTFHQLKRLGGSGDKGVDIAAFKSAAGFEGEWECYQAKHYGEPLTPSDVLPEVIKVIRHAAAGEYTVPTRYVLLAPKGCGPSLHRLLSHPSRFKELVLKSLAADSPYVREIDGDELVRIRALADELDYSIFESAELIDVLATHARTQYHAYRFATSLPTRTDPAIPPKTPEPSEARYIEQLVDVYREAHGIDELDAAAASDHPAVRDHFRRQRYAFYSAEALRVYARDSVPDGTFEALVDDVHSGVIDVADGSYATGMARLGAVLAHSTLIQLENHRLIEVTKPDDRKGICHHLANEDRLTWMRRQ